MTSRLFPYLFLIPLLLFICQAFSYAGYPIPYYHNDYDSFEESNYDYNIERVQIKLKKLGYNPGKIDGILGPNTKKAIKKFQKDNNLNPTGQLDSYTISSINIKIGMLNN